MCYLLQRGILPLYGQCMFSRGMLCMLVENEKGKEFYFFNFNFSVFSTMNFVRYSLTLLKVHFVFARC